MIQSFWKIENICCAQEKTQNVHKKILGTKCKIKRTKDKKENLVAIPQTLELLCTKCGKTKEPINNSTKTKTTSKVKKWKSNSCACAIKIWNTTPFWSSLARIFSLYKLVDWSLNVATKFDAWNITTIIEAWNLQYNNTKPM